MKPETISKTALGISKSLIQASFDPRLAHLVTPETIQLSQWFLEAFNPKMAKRWLWWCKQPCARPVSRLLSKLLDMVGITEHFLLRKAIIEDTCCAFLNQQQTPAQVIYLGAGFDTLLPRLAKTYPQHLFIELDHPATCTFKSQVLAQHQWQCQNLVHLPADLLQQNLTETLQSCPQYNANDPTYFIAEGLLMYIPLDRVKTLLLELHQLMGHPQAQLMVSAMNRPQYSVLSLRPLVGLFLIKAGEPLFWSMNPNEMKHLFQTCHLHCVNWYQTNHLEHTPYGHLLPTFTMGKVNVETLYLAQPAQ